MPTVDISNRICVHCGGTKWFVKTEKRTTKSGEVKLYTSYTCNLKKAVRDKKYSQAHPEKRKEIRKRYKSNSTKVKEYNIKYKLLNKDAFNAYSLKCKKKGIEMLSETYIKELLASKSNGLLSSKEITQDLIEIKRKQLLLTRQIKNNGKDN